MTTDPTRRTAAIRVITVRLPAALHARLRAEAEANYVSMNQLAIDKLLLPVPTEISEMVKQWNGPADTP